MRDSRPRCPLGHSAPEADPEELRRNGLWRQEARGADSGRESSHNRYSLFTKDTSLRSVVTFCECGRRAETRWSHQEKEQEDNIPICTLRFVSPASWHWASTVCRHNSGQFLFLASVHWPPQGRYKDSCQKQVPTEKSSGQRRQGAGPI